MHKAIFSKFQCGVAATIRIETGRYDGLGKGLRLGLFCNVLENEIHVVIFFCLFVFNCCTYDDLRVSLVRKPFECVPHFLSNVRSK